MPERLTQAARRRSTRAALLAAGAEVFARRGFAGASLDQVAARAGLTKGAVYHHFESKAALFLALAADRLAARAEQIPDAREAAARGGDAMAAALPFDRDWSLLFLEFVVHAAREPGFREELRGRLDLLRSGAAAALAELSRREGWPNDAPSDRVAAGIAALANGVSIDALLADDETEAANVFALMLELMLRGLRCG